MDTSPTITLTRLFVRIGGIECAHCVETLTHALGAVDGVASVRFRGLRAWSADPNAITYDCCEIRKLPEVPGVPESTASPYLDLAPGADGFVAVPLSRVTDKALYVNVPSADAALPAVQLIALRDGAGRARIAFNTCQSCNPSPRAWFAQRDDGRIVCQNCGNDFGPEAVGAATRGCNPAPIPGVRETVDAFLVPADALDAARPAFTRWAGPQK
jgi:hypothetical protein